MVSNNFTVDTVRFIELVNRFSEFGALSGGGISRPALSAVDIAAREFLVEYAGTKGISVWRDAAANLHFASSDERMCKEGSVVMTGSTVSLSAMSSDAMVPDPRRF